MPIPEYKIIRSKRKTLSLQITRDAVLEVRVPLWLPEEQIDAFVHSKQGWIEKNMAACRELAAERASFTLHYGGTALLRGQERPIIAGAGKKARFEDGSFVLPAGLDRAMLKQAVVRLYRQLAQELLPQKAAHYAQLMRLTPSAVKINSAKTRWGSCSSKGSINFSWRLIMADDALIDYVVVHELAHLRELNHSPRFWAVVASALPDYQNRKQQLRLLQKRLAAEVWD